MAKPHCTIAQLKAFKRVCAVAHWWTKLTGVDYVVPTLTEYLNGNT